MTFWIILNLLSLVNSKVNHIIQIPNNSVIFWNLILLIWNFCILDEVKQLVTDINNGNIKPIYFLMGEEPYYIDKISDYIEKNVLTEEEKGFNQVVLYGRDVSIEDIVENAKRYNMKSKRQ